MEEECNTGNKKVSKNLVTNSLFESIGCDYRVAFIEFRFSVR